MMSEKFTQGEWVLKDGFYPCFVDVHCGEAMKVPVCISATDLNYEQGAERIANAHLIAAAPEMYRMLEKMIGFSFEWNDEDDPIKSDIEKLLLEIRGEHE